MIGHHPMWEVSMPQQVDGTTQLLLQPPGINVGGRVVVQTPINASYVLDLTEYRTYIVTDQNDGTSRTVDLRQ